MARTIPEVFSGTPTIDADKVAAITQWYETALGDSDKAGEIDTAAYWEGNSDALRGVLSLLFDSPMYHKCAECHLFIEYNSEQGEGIAVFDHLHRGDAADEAIISTHEARPSGQSHTLDWWREHGPAEMRARFEQEVQS